MRKKTLVWGLIASMLGLVLSTILVPHVWIDGNYFQQAKTIILAGLVLGLINYFVKPILKLVTLPLRILTLGLIGLVINILIVWAVDILFPSLHIQGLLALFLSSLVIWLANLITPGSKKDKGLAPLN